MGRSSSKGRGLGAGRDPVAVHFGKNLLFHRRRAGLSQEKVGRRSSLHRTEVGLLERGARVPRIDTLMKIANALSIPPEALLKGISWKPESVQKGEFELGDPGDVPTG